MSKTPTIDRDALSRVVAVMNGKGGVLKTTLVANIGGMAAAQGMRVLLVDLDPQGNLGEDLGYTDDERNDEGAALAKALMFPDDTLTPVPNIRENLDVLVGGPMLDRASAALTAQGAKDAPAAKLALAVALQKIAADYDLVLLDCPPGEEWLQNVALGAARYALVPIKTDKSSRKGLISVAARLEQVVEVNPDIDLLGIVIVAVGSTSRQVIAHARREVANMFGSEEHVLESSIRHSEATAQTARERGRLVIELEQDAAAGPTWVQVLRGQADRSQLTPRTAKSVADDMQNVAREVVARITDHETEGAS